MTQDTFQQPLHALERAALTRPADLFDVDSERCPLHLQSNVAGMIAQEAGRPMSIVQLFCEHCPAPAPAAAAEARSSALAQAVEVPVAAAAAAVAPAPPPAAAAAAAAAVAAPNDAAALLSSLSLIDPAAEAIPYD